MAYLDRVQSDLGRCAEAGILTQDQAQKAAEHIAALQAAGRIKGVTWIALFAGLLVAFGVVLIVSHNWDSIPAAVKMAGFLALLGGAGWAAISTLEKPAAVNIPLELLWFFLPVVGIGLYAQIFQLSGDPVKPYLVWLALTLPLAALSRHRVVPTVQVAGLLILLYWGTLQKGTLLSLVDVALVAPILVTLILAAGAALSCFKLKVEHQVLALGAAFGWIFSMLVARTFICVRQEAYLLAAALALASLWLAFTAILTTEEGPRNKPRWLWLAIVYLGTFLWHARDHGPYWLTGQTAAGVSIVLLFSAAAVAGILVTPGDALSGDKGRAMFAKGVLILTALLPYAGLGDLKLVGAACNLILAVAALGLMWNGSLEGRAGQINAGVAALFMLIVTRFVDLFGSLLNSGIAFIGSGLLLALLAYALHKGRQTLLEQALRPK